MVRVITSFVALCAVLCAQQPNTLTAAERAAGWKLLFDGKDTSSWRGYRKKAFPEKGWEIEDGCLKVVQRGGGGDIITTGKYTNFEFVCEWRVSPKANSGIMYRVTEKHPAPWQTGPEYQVLDDGGYGKKPAAMHSAGALYALAAPPEDKVMRPTGEFNATRIVVRDDRVQHWLNGRKVVDCALAGDDWNARVARSKFEKFEGFGVEKTGHIGLQDHGNTVWYRSLKVRDLDAARPGEIALFDGTGLDAWTVWSAKGDGSGVWSVRDGVLTCKGEPRGYIKTKQSFESYVLTLEWRWDPDAKKGGNSGVLLRIHGEDRIWPVCVEAQLMSGNAGDIWNIGDQRLVTAEDRRKGRRTRRTHGEERPPGEWNRYEIIADGERITLAVNGEVVNVATRSTVRPGPVGLQSEGAPIHFRNIRLAPIRSR